MGRKSKATQSRVLNLGGGSKNPPNVMVSDDHHHHHDNFVLDYFGDPAESRDALQLCLGPCKDVLSESDSDSEGELDEEGDQMMISLLDTMDRLISDIIFFYRIFIRDGIDLACSLTRLFSARSMTSMDLEPISWFIL